MDVYEGIISGPEDALAYERGEPNGCSAHIVSDEVPRYKKKSQTKPPKKSKHKHVYEPCVFEFPKFWFMKEHVRGSDTRLEIREYCPVCGKISTNIDRDRRWRWESHNGGPAERSVPTDEALKEYNPETRTLPIFKSNDYFAKYVEVPEVEK